MRQTDILVIGGGIAGTATTCFLAQHGRQVLLLEQSELAAEASGLNAGTLWATGWGRTPDLSSTLCMGSLEIFQTLQLDLGYDLEFRQDGSLQAMQTEEEHAFARREAQKLLARGHHVELLDSRDARDIEPALAPGIVGCLYYPYGGNADPVKTALALASLAQRRGATILTHHEVTDIAHLDDGAYQVVTPLATFRAKTLVGDHSRTGVNCLLAERGSSCCSVCTRRDSSQPSVQFAPVLEWSHSLRFIVQLFQHYETG